jgi:hypothetical protein
LLQKNIYTKDFRDIELKVEKGKINLISQQGRDPDPPSGKTLHSPSCCSVRKECSIMVTGEKREGRWGARIVFLAAL